MGRAQGIGPLPQTTRRKRARLRAEILFGHQHEIDIPLELQVLEAVVEEVDRRGEMVLGEAAREIPV